MTNGSISGYAIGPGQHCGGKIGHGRGVCAHIGAVIVEKFIFNSENVALRIDCGADAMMLLTRMIGGDQMLAAVLYPFDWALEF